MNKILVIGACGRMGKEVVKAIYTSDNLQLVGAVDLQNAGKDIGEIVLNKNIGVKIENDLQTAIKNTQPDVAIDFTQPSIIFNNAKILLNNKVKPVIGTTGLAENQISELKKLSKENKTSALIAPNFTIGAVLMMMFAKTAAKYFDNAEIIELHHNQKKDAPSGTALKTAQLMSEENKDFTLNNYKNEVETLKGARGGKTESNIHIHSVRMPGYVASQEVLLGSVGQILKIRHDSIDRECYMSGVLLAVNYILDNDDTFIYGLENIL